MWSHDYCTVCDKQCAPGTMYCSDACRASELHKSQEVSSSSDSVYSTLYTTCRHHSLSSPLPLCENPGCTPTCCTCESAAFITSTGAPNAAKGAFPLISQGLYYTPNTFDSYDFSNPTTPELSPALTASSASPLSIRSDKFMYNHAHDKSQPRTASLASKMSPPPSPLLIPSGYYTSPKASNEFTSTSSNYRRWLSAV